MSKRKCEMCGKEFENFHAQGFDNKIYCPLCFFKKENTNLKQVLIDIRNKIDEMKCEFELNEYVTDFIEKLDNELQIIDKVTGDE